jgi:hypothetical protein
MPTEGYVYMLWYMFDETQLEVVFRGGITGHSWSGN